MRHLLTALGAAVLLVLPASGSVAVASCAVAPPLPAAIRAADVVFVGRVVGLSNANRWAEVQVDEIWRGPDLPAIVQVRGGPGGNVASSVDRTFEVGRYLFVPTMVDGVLHDSSCSSTTPWTPDLELLRPHVAPPPATSSEPDQVDAEAPVGGDTALGAVVAAIAAGVIALFGAVVLVARRRA